MSNEPPKRRRYPFSLKTLLAFVLAASVSVGWVGAEIPREREDRERLRNKARAIHLKIGNIHPGSFIGTSESAIEETFPLPVLLIPTASF